MSDRLLHVVSSYGRLRRNLFLECMAEVTGSSGTTWTEYDHRFGGLVTERAMDAMGHIDVSFDEQPWMVYAAPRLLVAQPTSTGVPIAILVGHRSPDTIDKLQQAAGDDVFVDIGSDQSGYPCLPNRVKVTAETADDLVKTAEAIGAEFIPIPPAQAFVDFSYSVDGYIGSLAWTKVSETNWPKRWFDPHTLLFVATPPPSKPALLEVENPFSSLRTYQIRDGDRGCPANRDWGRYAAFKAVGMHVLGYYDYAPGAGRGHLIVPVGAPVPRLLARAAALCSGDPPLFVPKQQVEMQTREWRGFYVFKDVHTDIAKKIAGKLGQVLQKARIIWKETTNA